MCACERTCDFVCVCVCVCVYFKCTCVWQVRVHIKRENDLVRRQNRLTEISSEEPTKLLNTTHVLKVCFSLVDIWTLLISSGMQKR